MIVRDELTAIRDQYGDKRRSEIVAQGENLSLEDLITPQDMVVTMSHGGYMKAQPVDEYRAQKRGGRGKQATATKEDDFIERMFMANTHDYILCFSNRGRVYWLKVYNVPQGTRAARGKPIVNLVPLVENEKITAILPVEGVLRRPVRVHGDRAGHGQEDLARRLLASAPVGDHRRRPRGRRRLIGVALTDGQHDVMLFSSGGKAVRFDETDVRPMGRNAAGVRGMMLDNGQTVISMLVAEDEQQSVLTATENGYGKRTPIVEYTRHARGTKGMIAIQQSERNGKVVAASLVRPDDEVILISTGGVLIRTSVKSIREMSRSTQGVTLINLSDGEKLAGSSGSWSGKTTTPSKRSEEQRHVRARPRSGACAAPAGDRSARSRVACTAQRAGSPCAGDRGAQGRQRRDLRIGRSGRRRCCRGSTTRTRVRSRRSRSPACPAGDVVCLALEEMLRVAYLGPAGTVQPCGGHEALRWLRRRGAVRDDRRGVSRDRERADGLRASCRSRTPPKARSGARLDLMCTTDLSICGEVKLRIQQNLLSNAGAMDAVRESLFACAVARAMRCSGSRSTCLACLAWRSQAMPEAARLAAAEGQTVRRVRNPRRA